MAEHAIPVDLYNPGQVFACLGFLEAADTLLGEAEGGFDWRDEADVRFGLRTGKEANPFDAVLEFLTKAEVIDVEPATWPAERSPRSVIRGEFPAPLRAYWNNQEKKWTRTALPVELVNGTIRVSLAHWADGSSRNPFKLYSGNRSACSIATAMISGTRAKPKKGQNIGDLETKGIAQLWKDRGEAIVKNPFEATPMGGSFNFDPRGAWTAIDAGYSPNEHDHRVAASPVVEFLAAWGLENSRPDGFNTREVRYAAWGIPLSPMLARAALCGSLVTIPLKYFRFELDMSGKNKVVTFAEPENNL
jgi:CRISPR-associated protein Csx14